ncbi:hypothetical protein CRM22_005942 [Opisthorchis felineus]|uniref:Uncharacterized protein n=1 Tax=Opisthorchis felineus TaxID=147828 RepID=A0A4S2LNN5_OPIFE|nr:hypothetical protein CRM22_005942 [Opisthorchis felineus]
MMVSVEKVYETEEKLSSKRTKDIIKAAIIWRSGCTIAKVVRCVIVQPWTNKDGAGVVVNSAPNVSALLWIDDLINSKICVTGLKEKSKREMMNTLSQGVNRFVTVSSQAIGSRSAVHLWKGYIWNRLVYSMRKLRSLSQHELLLW